MARPVRIRKSYTGDRSRLSRLEEAVEKDPRLLSEKKAEVLDLVRKLISLFMEVDQNLAPPRRRLRKKAA